MRPRLEAFLTPPYLSVFLIKLPPSFARSLEGALYIASVLVWETFCFFPRFIFLFEPCLLSPKLPDEDNDPEVRYLERIRLFSHGRMHELHKRVAAL